MKGKPVYMPEWESVRIGYKESLFVAKKPRPLHYGGLGLFSICINKAAMWQSVGYNIWLRTLVVET